MLIKSVSEWLLINLIFMIPLLTPAELFRRVFDTTTDFFFFLLFILDFYLKGVINLRENVKIRL